MRISSLEMCVSIKLRAVVVMKDESAPSKAPKIIRFENPS